LREDFGEADPGREELLVELRWDCGLGGVMLGDFVPGGVCFFLGLLKVSSSRPMNSIKGLGFRAFLGVRRGLGDGA
jgi:hypothetical protein